MSSYKHIYCHIFCCRLSDCFYSEFDNLEVDLLKIKQTFMIDATRAQTYGRGVRALAASIIKVYVLFSRDRLPSHGKIK